jgi:FAD/FMN-containing dehydrogenase
LSDNRVDKGGVTVNGSEGQVVSANMARRDVLVGGAAGAASLLIASGPALAAVAGSDAPVPAVVKAGVARGDAAYEQARLDSMWSQFKPARYPDRIVKAQTPADVIEVVRYASANGLTVTAKGSGHNYLSCFLRDGGIMLDVSALKAVRVTGDRAYIQPGIKSHPLAATLAENGRAFSTGHNGDVGIGGFLLGGGMGWNGENWGGFACFSVEAVDVVTATGDLVTASAKVHPELYWAAKGGGAVFPGIVTGFHVATRPYPKGMQRSMFVYPLAKVREVAEWLQAVGSHGYGDVENFLAIEASQESGEGRKIDSCRVYLLCYEVDAAKAKARLDEIMAKAPAGAMVKHGPGPATFDDLYAGSITGPSLRVANDTLWTDRGVEMAVRLADLLKDAPSPDSIAIVNFRGTPTLPADAPMPAASTFTTIAGQWMDPAADAENFAWVDTVVKTISPLGAGCYLNETDFERRPERARMCFTPAAWDRLAAVRRQYDPTGMFPPALKI